jgi:hypothetical protein
MRHNISQTLARIGTYSTACGTRKYSFYRSYFRATKRACYASYSSGVDHRTCSVAQTPEVIKLRQQGEEQKALERARERVERAVKDLKNKIASENEEVRQIYKQITPTFDPEDDGIWSEIDLLEGDPVHRGVAMRNLRFKPFWLKAEGSEWQGLWEKGVFKKWKTSDLLPNDRVFTSRYVYKIKRSAKTGEDIFVSTAC